MVQRGDEAGDGGERSPVGPCEPGGGAKLAPQGHGEPQRALEVKWQGGSVLFSEWGVHGWDVSHEKGAHAEICMDSGRVVAPG